MLVKIKGSGLVAAKVVQHTLNTPLLDVFIHYSPCIEDVFISAHIFRPFLLQPCIRKMVLPPPKYCQQADSPQCLNPTSPHSLISHPVGITSTMKTSITLGFSASLITLTLAQTQTEHRSVGDYSLKRGFETCQETYGGGSVTCGDSSSHYCYDPTLGEVSLPMQLSYIT